jgi:Raf kinase inhibitor-like YbhB/YbcL family protein
MEVGDCGPQMAVYHCGMRTAYALIGMMWVILFGVLIIVNHNFTQKGDTGVNATPSVTGLSTMASSSLILSSSAFQPDGSIPSQYTCDGDHTPPPLSIGGAPEGTQSFALIVEDPDVPMQIKSDGKFLHWVLFNIPASTTEIGPTGSVGVSGLNGSGEEGYTGPCPPKEYEPSEHRYIFSLYALDSELSLKAGATRDEVVQAMEGHIIAEAQLIGRYKKQ